SDDVGRLIGEHELLAGFLGLLYALRIRDGADEGVFGLVERLVHRLFGPILDALDGFLLGPLPEPPADALRFGGSRVAEGQDRNHAQHEGGGNASHSVLLGVFGLCAEARRTSGPDPRESGVRASPRRHAAVTSAAGAAPGAGGRPAPPLPAGTPRR